MVQSNVKKAQITIKTDYRMPNRKTPKKKPLTDTDYAIIRCLSQDARMPVAAVAAQLGQPESTIRHRLGKLVDEGAIQFMAVADPLQLGYPIWASIGVEVQTPHIRSAAEQLAALEETYFVGISVGGFDIFMAAVFRSPEHMLSFVTDTLANVPGVMHSVCYQHLEIIKRNLSLLPIEKNADIDGNDKKTGAKSQENDETLRPAKARKTAMRKK